MSTSSDIEPLVVRRVRRYQKNIPHSKLKDRLRELFHLCFIKENGQRRYKYPVQILLCKKATDSTKMFFKTHIINMLDLLIDNIFDMFDERDFQDSRHTYGYNLCFYFRRPVPLFINKGNNKITEHRAIFHKWASKEKPKRSQSDL